MGERRCWRPETARPDSALRLFAIFAVAHLVPVLVLGLVLAASCRSDDNALDFEVVVEGVEDQQTPDALREGRMRHRPGPPHRVTPADG